MGKATVWGPVLGAFILVPAQQYLAYRLGASELYLVGYAGVFLAVMLLLPRGILPSLSDAGAALPRPAAAGREGGGRVVSALLEVTGLRKRFGGVQAVDDCSFAVERGTVTGLIGPNGSGKTTVFNLVTGYLPADAGSVTFDGQIVRRPDPVRLARRGLIRTFQQARVFPQLTALENLVLAAPLAMVESRRVGACTRPSAPAAKSCSPTSTSAAHAQVPAAELSFGQRKLLEFAATLMSRPSVVLLDEPTSGVNPVLMETIERHIRRLNEEGLTFLVVEHDMPLVMRLCDPGDRARPGAEDRRGDRRRRCRAIPHVLDAYLGA